MYIANRSGGAPAIDETYFEWTNWIHIMEGYWTITEWPGVPAMAYYIHFDYGAILGSAKTNPMYVRAVRGVPITNQNLEDNGDGTVSDWGTSLMWEQHDENDYGPIFDLFCHSLVPHGNGGSGYITKVLPQIIAAQACEVFLKIDGHGVAA